MEVCKGVGKKWDSQYNSCNYYSTEIMSGLVQKYFRSHDLHFSHKVVNCHWSSVRGFNWSYEPFPVSAISALPRKALALIKMRIIWSGAACN